MSVFLNVAAQLPAALDFEVSTWTCPFYFEKILIRERKIAENLLYDGRVNAVKRVRLRLFDCGAAVGSTQNVTLIRLKTMVYL